MVYWAHTAAVYRVSGDSYTATSVTINGHLTKREFTSELGPSGWDSLETAVFIFPWEYSQADDAGNYFIKQGDRLLVDGNFWNVVSQVQARNEIAVLRESRVKLEKTVE